ncbi:mechanosensitive ion channel [Candidatus Woesearchaeota archaeon]|nr:mechanosensitive ion channel [Candidatus Woesearchaeota archaeon]
MIEELILSYLPVGFDNKYIVALIIFIMFVLVSKIFIYIVEKIILSLTLKTKTKLDDKLIERTNSPISWLLIFIGIRISLEYLKLENGFAHTLSTTALSLIYIATGIVIIAVVVTLIDFYGMRITKKTKSSVDDALVPLFRKTFKAVMFILLAVIVLDLWGVNITGLLAGLGIAGLAIGFAVKDSLSNIFGGISIILDKSVNVGEKIELSDGTVGIVEDVGIRATRIKTFDNEIVIVPNGAMSTMQIKNYNHPDMKARVVVPFSIEYGADPEKAKKVALAEIKKIKDILDDPKPSAILLEMADFSLNLKAFFWVDDISKVYTKREEALIRVYNAFEKNKIGIPFPTSTVHIKK